LEGGPKAGRIGMVFPHLYGTASPRIKPDFAHFIHLNKIIMRSDSLELIQAINAKDPHKAIYGIISDIKEIASAFTFCCFLHIPRSKNIIADQLAKWALRGQTILM
ncbi:hypothetical protein EUTSA_v10027466mg, partial [Eutrema salsugineum]